MKPDAGRITVLGEDITQMREEELYSLRRNIGMVFQESALFDSLTVEENVAYRLMEETGSSQTRFTPGCWRPCASWNWSTR